MSGWRLAGVLGLMTTMLLLAQPPAYAHTELSGSEPADGASTEAPLPEVVLTFSAPVTLIGLGFEVEDPEGNLLVPEVSSEEDTIFTLSFDPPLSEGEVTVRYEVTAADGHVVSGAVSYTVIAASTTSPAPVATIASATPTTLASSTAGSVQSPLDTSPPAEDDQRDDGSLALLAVGGAVAVGAGTVLMVRNRRNPPE